MSDSQSFHTACPACKSLFQVTYDVLLDYAGRFTCPLCGERFIAEEYKVFSKGERAGQESGEHWNAAQDEDSDFASIDDWLEENLKPASPVPVGRYRAFQEDDTPGTRFSRENRIRPGKNAEVTPYASRDTAPGKPPLFPASSQENTDRAGSNPNLDTPEKAPEKRQPETNTAAPPSLKKQDTRPKQVPPITPPADVGAQALSDIQNIPSISGGPDIPGAINLDLLRDAFVPQDTRKGKAPPPGGARKPAADDEEPALQDLAKTRALAMELQRPGSPPRQSKTNQDNEPSLEELVKASSLGMELARAGGAPKKSENSQPAQSQDEEPSLEELVRNSNIARELERPATPPSKQDGKQAVSGKKPAASTPSDLELEPMTPAAAMSPVPSTPLHKANLGPPPRAFKAGQRPPPGGVRKPPSRKADPASLVRLPEKPAMKPAGHKMEHDPLHSALLSPVELETDDSIPVWKRFWPAAASLLLLLTLGLQYLSYNATSLLEGGPLAGITARVCSVLACQEPPNDPSRDYQSRILQVRSHPTVPGALKVSFSFTNVAGKAVPFPNIELVFYGRDGQSVIANRLFLPYEYLVLNENLPEQMPSGTQIQGELELLDPGPDAVNYRLLFSR